MRLKRNINYNIYTSKNMRLNESNGKGVTYQSSFYRFVQLLFNLPRSLKMSPISRVWSLLLLCMFALVVLKSQHGKKKYY